MVRVTGVEPASLAALDPKSSASANSAIPASKYKWWTLQDSNLWPPGYEPDALTNWAKGYYRFKDIPKSYKTALLVNYIFNQAYTLIFFGLKSNFLAWVDCLALFISCLFLYQETNNLREKSSKFLDPYVLLALFATILSLTIYVINTI